MFGKLIRAVRDYYEEDRDYHVGFRRWEIDLFALAVIIMIIIKTIAVCIGY